MQRLARERGAAAFDRATFEVAQWSGAVPTAPDDIAFLPAHRLAALIKARRITAVQLTDIYLARLKRLDPTLLCAVTIMETQARAEAVRADAEIAAGKYRGPLHGLPYGLKDLFATKGVPTTWGAADFKDRVIDEDAEIAVRLRDAGAILIAKLATGLFAQNDWWYRGRTNNPWNLSQGSSGSSAGPASAAAAGCVAFAIGTETQGSIVSPAIRCGVSALRPTFGRVSRSGGMVLAWSQDRVGPICRSVEDCAMVFNAIHGVDESDPSTVTTPFNFSSSLDLGAVRIGVDPNAPAELVDGLRALGAKPTSIGARPTVPGMGGGGLGVEYAAAFDAYVQRKAKETGLDLNNLPERTPNPPGGGAAIASCQSDGTRRLEPALRQRTTHPRLRLPAGATPPPRAGAAVGGVHARPGHVRRGPRGRRGGERADRTSLRRRPVHLRRSFVARLRSSGCAASFTGDSRAAARAAADLRDDRRRALPGRPHPRRRAPIPGAARLSPAAPGALIRSRVARRRRAPRMRSPSLVS